MRVMGHNAFAIIVAALVIYAIEFVIFGSGLLMSADEYMTYIGNTEDQLHSDRMPFGVIMPILAAIGLSLAIKWRGAAGWRAGAITALWMAVLFGFGTSLYGWVYGSHDTTYLPLNLAHFLISWGAAGAVLGAWK
jgi:hypothetical protein